MLFFAVLFAIQFISNSGVAGWRYMEGGPSGPEHWHVNYSDCGSVMQSPININTSRVLFDPNIKLLNFSDYGVTSGVELELENLGYIAQVKVTGPQIGISGGGLPSRYRLMQIQFHWRSEHLINDESYTAEIHFVHGQEGLEVSDATTHPYGHAVIAFFVKLGKTNMNYEPLLKYFVDIKVPNTAMTIPTFPVSQLLPASDRLDFFSYLGSWTYPPCSENVVWFVAEAVIEISAEQLSLLTQLQNEDGNQMTTTRRPVQPLSHRTVTTLCQRLRAEERNWEDTAMTIPTFPVSQLLPASDRLDFFSYLGSWTYPPCSENVVWFVAEAVIEISAEQLSLLTQLQNEDGNQMTNTRRPVQPLSHRTVFTTNKYYLRTFPSQAYRSGQSGIAIAVVVCSVWLLLYHAIQLC